MKSVRDVMTTQPLALPATASAVGAAQAMRDRGVGGIVVLDGHGNVYGIVTDRDLAVRVMAEGRDPSEARLGDICSKALVTVAPTDTVEEAVRVMRDQAVRRLPVVASGKAVGIVSLGDLAVERDPDSVLAGITRAPATT